VVIWGEKCSQRINYFFKSKTIDNIDIVSVRSVFFGCGGIFLNFKIRNLTGSCFYILITSPRR